MKLSTQTHIEIPWPVDEVFDFLVAAETFPTILHKRGPIPGIAAAEMIDGAPLQRGERRSITLTDGVLLEEEIVAFERPVEHGYRWSGGLRPPFAWLVRSGHGHWTFTATDDGTRVEWRYAFELTNPLVYPVALIVVQLFRGWMSKGLANGRQALTSRRANEAAA